MMPRSTSRPQWCMTIWDLNESPFLSTYEHSVKDSLEQVLNDAYWAWEAPTGYWANTRKRRKRYVEGAKSFLTTGLSRFFLRSPFTIRSSTRRRWNLFWSIFWKPPQTKNFSISNEVSCTTPYTLMRPRNER